MSGSGNEEKTFRRFLELFLREMRPPLLEDQPLPMRPLSDLISEDEVEGECIDLCLQHLCKYNCPFSLAAGLARGTADGVLQSDLSGYQHSKPAEEGTEPFPQLDSVKLARLVFNKLYETCYVWLKEFPWRRRAQPYYETSIHAIKNMRRKMEDKHVVIPDFNTLFNLQDQEEQAFFAVFDGHGGVDAATYAANHLHVNLVRQESFRQDPAEALCKAFRLTDERFVQKASRENLRCGTTGVVTFVRGRTLYVAWLGDSQVMLVKRGQPVELMKPHKPDREDEKQRIEALGGCVIWFGTWRVNGSLSVSRAIGDSEHKPYICGDADHSAFPLDGSEDYLILACDGFYDTVNPDEAVRIVSDHLAENAGDTAMVAHKLVASARDAGSSDNITVIVVFLRDPRAPLPSQQSDDALPPPEEESAQEQGEGLEQEGGGPGGKGRGGWPLQQCSAPADLGYEDRMDSFTDRTSLSTAGPSLSSGLGGTLRLPAISRQPPLRSFATPELLAWPGLGSSWRPRGEEGLCVYRSRGLLPSSQFLPRTDRLLPPPMATLLPAATLLPLVTLLSRGDQRRRRMKRLPLRRVGPLGRPLPLPQMLLRCPSAPPPPELLLGGSLPLMPLPSSL